MNDVLDIKKYCIEKEKIPYDTAYFLDLLSSEEYLKSLQNQSLPIYPNYSDTITNKCRDATAWAIGRLHQKKKIYVFSFSIMEGYVNDKHHVWLKHRHYYIDLTMAQFYPNAPKQCVFREDSVKDILYHHCTEYSVKEWIELESIRPY